MSLEQRIQKKQQRRMLSSVLAVEPYIILTGGRVVHLSSVFNLLVRRRISVQVLLLGLL